jgi:hypothetical protein
VPAGEANPQESICSLETCRLAGGYRRQVHGAARDPAFKGIHLLHHWNRTNVDTDPQSPTYLRHNVGRMEVPCTNCGALHWLLEKTSGISN